jgi:hypothetical protein
MKRRAFLSTLLASGCGLHPGRVNNRPLPAGAAPATWKGGFGNERDLAGSHAIRACDQ